MHCLGLDCGLSDFTACEFRYILDWIRALDWPLERFCLELLVSSFFA